MVASYAGGPGVESSSTEIYKHVLSIIVECRGQMSGFKVVWAQANDTMTLELNSIMQGAKEIGMLPRASSITNNCF